MMPFQIEKGYHLSNMDDCKATRKDTILQTIGVANRKFHGVYAKHYNLVSVRYIPIRLLTLLKRISHRSIIN